METFIKYLVHIYCLSNIDIFILGKLHIAPGIAIGNFILIKRVV